MPARKRELGPAGEDGALNDVVREVGNDGAVESGGDIERREKGGEVGEVGAEKGERREEGGREGGFCILRGSTVPASGGEGVEKEASVSIEKERRDERMG